MYATKINVPEQTAANANGRNKGIDPMIDVWTIKVISHSSRIF